MTPRVNGRLCRRRSRFGSCHRTRGHHGVHATFIGDRDFWFAWSGRNPLGYGRLDHGRFRSML